VLQLEFEMEPETIFGFLVLSVIVIMLVVPNCTFIRCKMSSQEEGFSGQFEEIISMISLKLVRLPSFQ